ncbi:protein-tyrosine phosphatase-like protein [Crepidotus variabilis]|uniref:Protein-tyrosine phosphatase-like protein n=1 Tax=Crepidotus variabilis TaxID=179855 RepID=A0A9P6ELP7_9AGAR|nr:protein-tyrosine phosphatase-like protein [Crepidotus variabilis]
MTSSTLPTWLATALSSEKQMVNGIRVLASRESQRDAASTLSRRAVFEQAHPSLKGALSFLDRKSKEHFSKNTKYYAVTAGSQRVHHNKNRYTNVTPYDRTRVVVHDGRVGYSDQLEDRYLNASWVLEKAGHKWWIASQAPLPHSAHAFLSMMLQPAVEPPYSSTPSQMKIRTVVQLTRNVESGRRKADAYFPSEVGQSFVVPPEDQLDVPALEVTLHATRRIPEADCFESLVSIVPTSGHETNAQPVFFKHLLYSSWPDHGVPEMEDRESLLAFIRLVDATNRNPDIPSLHNSQLNADPDPPIVVGCSAGIGRTGSFIALSSLLRHHDFLQPPAFPTSSSVLPASPLGAVPSEVKDDEVVQEIDSLREQRPGMVQREEQTLLVYEVLAAAFGFQMG